MTDPHAAVDPPLRVLLVEDDPAHADGVAEILTAQIDLVQVEVVADLAAARLALTTPPDLVIADLTLPDADSLGVVHALRTACPDTVVILVARRDDPALALAAITAGADDVLVRGDHDALMLGAAVQRAVQRRRTQAQLQRRERYAASLLDAAESATCALDAEGRIVSVNASWRSFAAANGGEAGPCGVGASYLDQCDHALGERCDGAAEISDGIRAVLRGDLLRFEHEYSCHAPNRKRWYSARVWPQPNGNGAVVSHIDVTASRLADRAAARQELHDAVTGLPNARLLHDRLEQVLAEGARSGRLVGVALVELGQVDDVRLRHGQEARDQVLVEVADRLTGCLRGSGTVGQLGPDRFVVVWGELTSPRELRGMRDLIGRALAEPVRLPGARLALTPRIGTAVDEWAQTAEELLLAAAADLHTPVPEQLDQLQLPRPRDGDRQRTEAELRLALERDELVVHYQPVVDLETGRVVGVEALVRWQHPTEGLIPPSQFIPIAESGGLIVALGTVVLEQACRQAVRWRDEGRPLQVAVNLSARQVAHPDLLRSLQRVLRETGLAPVDLVLEVTESAVMVDIEASTAVLNAIAALGVSLSIDDFGTGYGPMVYLKRYPIHALKIDRSFVHGMGSNAPDDAIVASVVELARAFGGVCVAEGVETSEQYVDLVLLDCRYAQGWLFGAAVPAGDLPALVLRCELALVDLRMLVPDHAAARERAGERRDSAATERDLAGDDRDDAGDERDSQADRRDVVAGERDVAARHRDQAGDERDEVGHQRDRAGSRRDDAADERDRVADERDDAADRRDRVADRRDEADERDPGTDSGVAALARSARLDAAADRTLALQDRHAGASERAQAEQDRGVAHADRGAGAVERTRAVHDRDTAHADRGAGADERDQAILDRATAQADRGAGAGQRRRAQRDREDASADRSAGSRSHATDSFDPLTGARLQQAGMHLLESDVSEAHAAGAQLVVAHLEVDGPEPSDGELVEVAASLRAVLRPSSLVLRSGPHGFVCALPDTALADAVLRLGGVNALLAAAGSAVAVTAGVTTLRAGETAAAVVARAGTELERRRAVPQPGPA